MKKCTKCGVLKELSDFHKRIETPIGVQSQCKKCRAESQKKNILNLREYQTRYRNLNKEKIKNYLREYNIENKERIGQNKKKYRKENKDSIEKLYREAQSRITYRAKRMFNEAKRTAPKRNLTFSICADHVIALLFSGKCSKSGIKFDFGPSSSTRNPFGPSLDRIDNNRGYEPDNIQIVCNFYNIGKSDNNEIDFLAFCLAVAAKQGANPCVVKRFMEIVEC